LLFAVGIDPVDFPPLGFFQVHTYWDSEEATAGLKSWSVIIRSNIGGEVGRTSQEGFDMPGKQ